MDTSNLIRLGQIRQQEIVREAENYRLGQALRESPSLWRRLLVRLSAARGQIGTSTAREPATAGKVIAAG